MDMVFKLIPAGEFEMGIRDTPEELVKLFPYTEAAWYGDVPLHRVKISKPFYLCQHEVTVGQFRKFVNESGHKMATRGNWGYDSKRKSNWVKIEYNWQNVGWTQSDDHPVVNVNWDDALAFCAWLSKEEGKTYRLPTEAEWELACRAGTKTRYWFGDDPQELARYDNTLDAGTRAALTGVYDQLQRDDSHIFTSPVGSYAPNPFGLYDMHGNVFEWCLDWYDEEYYRKSPVVDPRGPESGTKRVLRGGAWNGHAAFCCTAFRAKNRPKDRNNAYGFRVALIPDD
jgi:formylglycine-generating enzyme required for sulfatase activity